MCLEAMLEKLTYARGMVYRTKDHNMVSSFYYQSMNGKLLTEKQVLCALKILKRSAGHLGLTQQAVDKFLENPVLRHPMRSAGTIAANRLVAVEDNGLVKSVKIYFKYSDDIKNRVNVLRNRTWHGNNPSDKYWSVPLNGKTCCDLMSLAKDFGFEVDEGIATPAMLADLLSIPDGKDKPLVVARIKALQRSLESRMPGVLALLRKLYPMHYFWFLKQLGIEEPST